MQIKWRKDMEKCNVDISNTYKIRMYEGISDNHTFYINVDFYREEVLISCYFNTAYYSYTVYIPFRFSQIPGDQNDNDLLVLAHQLIEKEIQTLKENGRY